MRNIDAILQKYDGVITGLQDLTGDAPPSKLFYCLANRLSYLMDLDPKVAISERGVHWRKSVHFIIKNLGPFFLSAPQVIENRYFLKNPNLLELRDDSGIVLPEKPVIWAANHGFKDDVLASVLAAYRHAYILFGSLPQFYNTFDGITAWLNGVVMANRKMRNSSHSSVSKAIQVMKYGSDLLIFPEGVWNKSPNALLLDLWPGIYRIACETGAEVIPIVHYIRDYSSQKKDNIIHTVIDNPIRLDDLSERAALSLLRDAMATWHYLMMEVYGKSSRKEILEDIPNSKEAWEAQLIARVKTAARYDSEIELCADYRPKSIIRPEQVWKQIADIKHPIKANILDVEYARRLVKTEVENNFQRRF